MLKVWNIVLIIITFSLTIFGTFLTRSGIIASVHSFGQSTLGYYFLPSWRSPWCSPCSCCSAGSTTCGRATSSTASSPGIELPAQQPAPGGDGWCGHLGVLYPIISEALFGNKATVGPPFFNTVMAPLGLVLMFLTGICPLIAWRRATFSNLRKNFAYPAGRRSWCWP